MERLDIKHLKLPLNNISSSKRQCANFVSFNLLGLLSFQVHWRVQVSTSHVSKFHIGLTKESQLVMMQQNRAHALNLR